MSSKFPSFSTIPEKALVIRSNSAVVRVTAATTFDLCARKYYTSFIMPETLGPALLATAYSLVSLSTVFVAARYAYAIFVFLRSIEGHSPVTPDIHEPSVDDECADCIADTFWLGA